MSSQIATTIATALYSMPIEVIGAYGEGTIRATYVMNASIASANGAAPASTSWHTTTIDVRPLLYVDRMATTEEICSALATCFANNADVPMVSATLFRWADFPAEQDAQLLIVLDRLPTKNELQNLARSLDTDAPAVLSPTWMMLESARADLRQLGGPLTELAASGAHVAGTPLAQLVPDPAPYDPNAVRVAAHELAQRWVARLRERRETSTTGTRLAIILESSADAAMMHHRLGRLAPAAIGVPTAVGERRLGRLIGAADARTVVEAVIELNGRGEADCSDALDTTRGLIDAMLAVASDPEAPGCALGCFMPG